MLNNLRGLALVALFVMPAAFGGCVLTGTPAPVTPGTPSPTQVFGTCSTAALRTASEGILGEVTTALATGDYEAELAKLAVTYSAAEVGCAVDLAVAELQVKAARTNDTQTQVMLVHATAWRAAHPAQ